MIDKRRFIEIYTKELMEDNAAIFAGAGLSVSSGYVSWKELLRDIADELKLNIDKEHDLVAIAQYHVNRTGNRGQLNQRIIEKFTSETRESEVHNILARLPIRTYWTTNYDRIIEDTLLKNKRKIDVKIVPSNLAINVPKRDAVIYKMHGDITLPSEAIITKDDYETYNVKRQLFTTALQGDLVSKTFLFVGFSFEDPNLDFILSRIRVLLGENQRNHYAILRKPKREDYDEVSQFEYAQTKQSLRIEDLKRYSIQVLLIEEYSEIEEILHSIELRINYRNIFISGSAEEYGSWTEINAVSLITELTNELIRSEYRVVSGFGYGIGSHIISSAVKTIDETKYMHFDDYLRIRPFPFQLSQPEKEEFNKKYRNSILSQCGVAIFLFGNKKNNGKVVIADGVLEEFNIALEKGLVVIPIGSTGYATKSISETVNREIAKYPYLEGKMEILDNITNNKDICKEVISIINAAKTLSWLSQKF